jgi:hypothetical protein
LRSLTLLKKELSHAMWRRKFFFFDEAWAQKYACRILSFCPFPNEKWSDQFVQRTAKSDSVDLDQRLMFDKLN